MEEEIDINKQNRVGMGMTHPKLVQIHETLVRRSFLTIIMIYQRNSWHDSSPVLTAAMLGLIMFLFYSLLNFLIKTHSDKCQEEFISNICFDL